ncbi:MAG: hypothetical protein H3C43_04940 [Leptonema sp. (in: Bacteria)]|nr:hypothetical protein [Leptonema sp. (in: bacteria)]
MSNHTLMIMGHVSGELGMALIAKLFKIDTNIVLVDRKTDPKVSFRSLLKSTNQNVLTYKLDLSRTSYLKIFMSRVKESFQTVQTIVLLSDSIPFAEIESFSTHQLQLFYRRNILAFASVIRSGFKSSILNTNTNVILVSDIREGGIISNICEAGIEALVKSMKDEIPSIPVVHLRFSQADSVDNLANQIVGQIGN